MSKSKDVQRAEPQAMELAPAKVFWVVVDLNTMHAAGPYNTIDEARYKAAELASQNRGLRPVGVFEYKGGVTTKAEPLFWNDVAE
jgi:hypothetical protein